MDDFHLSAQSGADVDFINDDHDLTADLRNDDGATFTVFVSSLWYKR